VCELICIVALPYYCRKFYPLVGVFAPPRIKKNNNIHTLVYNPTDLLYTQRCANANNILYTQHFLLKICNSKISSFCYAHKRPSPFFLYIPTKNPLFNDKVWTYYRILVSKRSSFSSRKVPTRRTSNIAPQRYRTRRSSTPSLWLTKSQNVTGHFGD